MLRYNHIDTLDYINKLFPNIVASKIRQVLRDFKYIMVNLTITTFDYLFRNDIIDIESVKRLVNEPVFDKMKKYNMDALRYIEIPMKFGRKIFYYVINKILAKWIILFRNIYR